MIISDVISTTTKLTCLIQPHQTHQTATFLIQNNKTPLSYLTQPSATSMQVEFVTHLAITQLDHKMLSLNSDDFVSVSLNHLLSEAVTLKCIYRQ